MRPEVVKSSSCENTSLPELIQDSWRSQAAASSERLAASGADAPTVVIHDVNNRQRPNRASVKLKKSESAKYSDKSKHPAASSIVKRHESFRISRPTADDGAGSTAAAAATPAAHSHTGAGTAPRFVTEHQLQPPPSQAALAADVTPSVTSSTLYQRRLMQHQASLQQQYQAAAAESGSLSDDGYGSKSSLDVSDRASS